MTNGIDGTKTVCSFVEISPQQHDFDLLLAENRQKIVLYLFSLVRQIADAEDLCQRCSLIMWKKFPEYDRQRSFLAWACGIARHEAMNYRRWVATDRLRFQTDVAELLAVALESSSSAQAKQRLTALKTCVRSLPSTDRRLVQRIYWEGASLEIVAHDLGCTLKTTYNRMSLLRRKLSECVCRRLKLESNK